VRAERQPLFAVLHKTVHTVRAVTFKGVVFIKQVKDKKATSYKIPLNQGRSCIGLHANFVYLCVCALRWGVVVTKTFSASRGFPRSAFAHGKEPASLEILFTLKCVSKWKTLTWKSTLALC